MSDDGPTYENGACECVCGGTIRAAILPSTLAVVAGSDRLWVHVLSLDSRCYPDDDPDCYAEPYAPARLVEGKNPADEGVK